MALVIYSQSPSPIGESVYRFSAIAAPAQYVPVLRYKAALNKASTNTTMSVDIDAPIVTVVDGVTQSLNGFKCGFYYTSLRNVTEDTMRVRVLDEMIAFLTAHKAEIAAGQVTPIP